MHITEKHFNRRRTSFGDFPAIIKIETVMGCNLRCAMCPVPQARSLMNGRTFAMMSDAIFQKVLDAVSDTPRSVSLNQMGEPLLHGNIVEYVRLAKARGHQVSLTTNATKLSEDLGERLLLAGLDQMTVSIDGVTEQTYESIRVGARYHAVRENVEAFLRIRDRLRRPARLQIHCIESEVTRGEIADFQRYWSGKADSVCIIHLDDWAGKFRLPQKYGARNWVPTTAGGLRYPCDLLWTTLAVSAEGRAMYCCHDFKLESRLPSVEDVPLREIWSRFLAKERARHVAGSIDSEPCLHCDAWRTRLPYFDWQYRLASGPFGNALRWVAERRRELHARRSAVRNLLRGTEPRARG